jgi:histone-lysine N-methyltransferase SETMAR
MIPIKIKSLLKRQRFSSARYISRKSKIPRTTVGRWLKKMNFKRMKIKATRYPMTISVQNRRKEIITVLLNELKLASPIDVITSDESWFFLQYNHEWIWVTNKDEVEEVERRALHATKFMVCFFWNFVDFHFIYILDVGEKYNSKLVVDTIFPLLENVAFKHRPTRGLKSYSLHWDNARPHQSIFTTDEVNKRFKMLLPHPAYSPELAPSDFFLNGYLKYLLMEKKIENKNHLFEELEKAFKSITRETKMNVFNAWLRKLEEAVDR